MFDKNEIHLTPWVFSDESESSFKFYSNFIFIGTQRQKKRKTQTTEKEKRHFYEKNHNYLQGH
jgi:hypothetical protein